MENKEKNPEPVGQAPDRGPSERQAAFEQPQGQSAAKENVSDQSKETGPAEPQVDTGQAGTAPESPPSKEIDRDARLWAMICHLSALAGIILPASGNIVAPLIIWQIKKDDNPFIDEQGKEAVNFQISMSIYFIASVFLCIFCVGAFLVAATIIVFFVFLLIAAVKANNGYHYRYPLSIRFIK
jgi:hypothetical protein